MKRIVSFIAATMICLSCGVVAFAEGSSSDPYIPDNEISLTEGGNHYTPPTSQQGASSSSQPPKSSSSKPSSPKEGDLFDTSGMEDVAGGLFGEVDLELQDMSGNPIVRALNSNLGKLASMILAIFPALVLLHFVVDIICLISPPIRQFFCKQKIQWFSDEAAQYGGFSLQTGQGGQGGYSAAPAPPPATPDGQGSAGHPVTEFAKARIWRIFLCFFLLVLCGSGQLFKLLGFVTNLIIHLCSGIV